METQRTDVFIVVATDEVLVFVQRPVPDNGDALRCIGTKFGAEMRGKTDIGGSLDGVDGEKRLFDVHIARFGDRT